MENPRKYCFDEFEFDADNRRLSRGDQPVTLSAKAFDLLHTLLANNGRLVGKEELFNSVWRDQIVEESNLTVHISQIRKALGENRNNPRYLETVPGHGYRFTADLNTPVEDVVFETHTLSRITIENEYASALESIDPAEWADGWTPPNRALLAGSRPARGRWFTAGLLAVSLLAVFGGYFLYRSWVAAKPESFSDPTIRQLTDKGNINWAIISPDGKFFAYSAQTRDQGDFKLGLWLAQTDGSNEILIRPPEPGIYRGLAFSSDSKTLYFSHNSKDQSYRGTLFRMPVLGGVPEKVWEDVGEFLSLSPDDRNIAYFRTDAERKQSLLIVAALDGSGERELLALPLERSFSTYAPTWSPDGSRLAVGALDEEKDEEFFVVNLSNGNFQKVTNLGFKDILNLVWHSEGRGLVAIAKEKGVSDNQLWQINLTDGKSRRISRDTDTYGFPLSISADGRHLLATQGRTESNIWLAPADRLKEPKQITFSSIGAVYGWSGIDWSPDGRIFFIGRKGQSLVIYAMRPDAEETVQITPDGFSDQKLSVSPDGKFIAFQSNRSGRNEIWRIALDGTEMRQLTDGGMNTSPDVSSDGKWITYVSGRFGKTSIRRIPAEGGQPLEITDRSSFSPRFSPDGKWIAYFLTSDDKNLHRLAIGLAGGGEPVKTFYVPRSANLSLEWTPDSKAICYRDWVSGIWRQDLDSGEPVKLSELSDFEILPFAWSLDGRTFAFTRGRTISDAVLISDLK